MTVIALLYGGVVVLSRLAFQGFTTDRVAGLFLSFTAGLVLGVAGPIVYTVWVRRRALSTLGITGANLRPTIGLALLFASVQFAMTLWGYHLPKPVDWVPLLVMSVVVGAFEAVFFRGFVQGRLEASFGTAPGVAAAALLYALYHVGYGMGGGDMVFLFGLGVVYAVAYRLVGNVLVLWPLLTPLGAFFNNLEEGTTKLPWASIAGFVDGRCRRAQLPVLAETASNTASGESGPPSLNASSRRYTSAAAWWNPSGSPAAANVAAISSISTIHRHALGATARAECSERVASPGWEVCHASSTAASTPIDRASARRETSRALVPFVQAAYVTFTADAAVGPPSSSTMVVSRSVPSKRAATPPAAGPDR